MSEIQKAIEILNLINSDNNKGYCNWENKTISVLEANHISLKFLKNINTLITENSENHMIMIVISNKRDKTLAETNMLRWRGETFDFEKNIF